MRFRAWALSVVTVGFGLGIAAPSWAEPAADPTAKERQTAARALIEKGDKALLASFLGEAAEAWRAAWELDPDPELACNIGRLEMRRGRARDAAEFLTRCVNGVPAPRNAEEKQRQAEERGELAKARLQVGALRIEVSEPGAAIVIDGRSVGRSPLVSEQFVEPGKRQVTATLPGRKPAVVVLDVLKGSSRTLFLKLEPLPPSRPVASKPPPPPASGPPLLAVVLGGAGAALGLAAFGTVSAAVSYNRAEDSRSLYMNMPPGGSASCSYRTDERCIEAEDAKQRAQVFGALSGASFVAAGVAAIGTAYWALRGRGSGGVTATTTGRSAGITIVF